MTKPREIFHFNPQIQSKSDWMLELTDLEVYNSSFNITEENNIFELNTGHLDTEFPYTTMKDNVAEVLGLSDISS